MRIAQYEAPKERLIPNSEGFQAWETAGRRIGPLYNQEAQDIKEEGRLKAQEIEDIARWPFDILDLRNRVAEDEASKNKGLGYRISQKIDTTGTAGDGSAYSDYQPLQEVSRGANMMARLARNLVAPGSVAQDQGSQVYDPNAVAGGTSYTLQGGNLMKVNNSDPNAYYAKQNQEQAQQINESAAEWFNQGTPNNPGPIGNATTENPTYGGDITMGPNGQLQAPNIPALIQKQQDNPDFATFDPTSAAGGMGTPTTASNNGSGGFYNNGP